MLKLSQIPEFLQLYVPSTVQRHSSPLHCIFVPIWLPRQMIVSQPSEIHEYEIAHVFFLIQRINFEKESLRKD